MNETKQRKIIQIAALPASNNDSNDGVLALTDDGRLYVLYNFDDEDNRNRGKWSRLPDIP
jgi:hypothetical protein